MEIAREKAGGTEAYDGNQAGFNGGIQFVYLYELVMVIYTGNWLIIGKRQRVADDKT